MSQDYIYAVTRVRARETGLLTKGDLERLMAFLEYLDPATAIERLFSRIPEKDAVFCNWGTSWWKLRDEFLSRMKKEGSFQGRRFQYLNGAALKQLD